MNGSGRHGRTRIKICGVTSVEIARVAAGAGADFIGFMQVSDSPRYIEPGPAAQIAREIPAGVQTVSVFRDAVIANCHEARGGVQLHGREDEAFVERLRCECAFQPIIRAFAMNEDEANRWDANPWIDLLLIEGAAPGVGQGFDHEKLVKLMPALTKPVILAGGLTPDNVGEAIRIVRPWGVDVSTGVESARGVKDPNLIRAFCDAVREADAALDAG